MRKKRRKKGKERKKRKKREKRKKTTNEERRVHLTYYNFMTACSPVHQSKIKTI